jgi:hypothetical protein
VLEVESMDFERTADRVMTVLPLPVALWMGLTGNLVSMLGLLSFSSIALLRRRSTRLRQWTNQHQWLFLAILTPIAVATTLDAMS